MATTLNELKEICTASNEALVRSGSMYRLEVKRVSEAGFDKRVSSGYVINQIKIATENSKLHGLGNLESSVLVCNVTGKEALLYLMGFNKALVIAEQEPIDLLENPELLPLEVQAVLEQYCTGDNTYENCEKLTAELNAVGYTISYYLDAEPFNLRKL